MTILKVGDTVPPWKTAECQCGVVYDIARCESKVIQEKDLMCCDCREIEKQEKRITKETEGLGYELDNLRRENQLLKKTLYSMVEVSEELNYRIRNGRACEGFHHMIEEAKILSGEGGE